MIALLIPALEPEQQLLDLLHALEQQWTDPVLLVDDGSTTAEAVHIFEQAQRMGAVVVHHARNLGKGRALKTGFNECLVRWQDLEGVVTADADGQHLPEDIIRCRDALRERPEALVLGCRDFSAAQVPWKSSCGNRFTRFFMKICCGVSVTDTQTGLRGIPAGFMRELLAVPGERFEYETNMLLFTKTLDVPIYEITIKTVYLEQNRASHFRPFGDSLQIYALLLKFCMASLIGFVVDIAGFTLISKWIAPLALGVMTITVATVSARILSAIVNYLINYKVVFKSKRQIAGSAWRYALLCVVQMMASAGLVTAFAQLIPISTVGIKIIVDLMLFFISFQIQRRLVF